MIKSVLAKYGITGTTEVLFTILLMRYCSMRRLRKVSEGFEVGQETELGAVNVMTGIYTGRSPKDKFIVDDATSHDTVWWDSEEYHNDNHKATQRLGMPLRRSLRRSFLTMKLFVVDGFCRYTQGYTYEGTFSSLR